MALNLLQLKKTAYSTSRRQCSLADLLLAGCPKVVPGAIAKKQLPNMKKETRFRSVCLPALRQATSWTATGSCQCNQIPYSVSVQQGPACLLIPTVHSILTCTCLTGTKPALWLLRQDRRSHRRSSRCDGRRRNRSDKRCRYPADNLSHGRSYHHRVELPPPERNPRDA